MTEKSRARLWVHWNNTLSRITITEGERPVGFRTWRRTDEGWESEVDAYWLDRGTIYRECIRDGRDCDGRLRVAELSIVSGYREAAPDGDPLGRLGEHPVMVPIWAPIEAEQFDEYAEAAGY